MREPPGNLTRQQLLDPLQLTLVHGRKVDGWRDTVGSVAGETGVERDAIWIAFMAEDFIAVGLEECADVHG